MTHSSEAEHARAFWQWLCLCGLADPVFKVPNERPQRAARRMLGAEGVRKGVADYVGLVPVGGWHGFALELKSPRGALTYDQAFWLNAMARRGYCCMVAWSWQGAALCVARYFGMGSPAYQRLPRGVPNGVLAPPTERMIGGPVGECADTEWFREGSFRSQYIAAQEEFA